MSILPLGICCGGVYAMFLLWAIAQERLSVPFPSVLPHEPPARFSSILTLNTAQAFGSLVASFLYLLVRRPSSSQSLKATLGLARPNESAQSLLFGYFKIALINTCAAPFGFASLRHISYPTMVLGKSCKLVPVLFMNVLLYRRKFPPHKYLVVSLVTLGISLFMLLGSEGPSSKHSTSKKAPSSGGESLLGLGLLVVNLLIDGATNSSQDELFKRFRGVTGQQMMFFMSLFTLLISVPLISLPLPAIPLFHPHPSPHSELHTFSTFLQTHPTLLRPLLLYALTGALGQLFIFETLERYGSLTLVMVTVTRKLFTMMLSVVLFDHKLTAGQWLGAGVVFIGIGVEAWAKITEGKEKKLKAASANGQPPAVANGKAKA